MRGIAVSLVIHGLGWLALRSAGASAGRSALGPALVDLSYVGVGSMPQVRAFRRLRAVGAASPVVPLNAGAASAAAASPWAETAGPVGAGGTAPPSMEVAPFVEYRPAPHYPEEALDQGLEGDVLIQVRTDASGAVVDAIVVGSSGQDVLDQEALVTVRSWRLKPLKTWRVPIRFHLS